ncbi:MAG TPA: hypothetical protein VIA62_05940 [Thermoanaerobaculia bacterium]|jgi:hypothetical protein|nr:hypothetical protein [Thermoanaerobaculia bacterium]
MRKIRLTLLVGAALLLAPAIVHAQFQGDVFFAKPSVAIPEGGTAVLEVQMFSGSDVVGATQVDFIFDPTQAKVVKVEPGTTPQLANGLATVTAGNRVALVDLNGSSLEQPFGTVSLALIHVQPLLPAGSRIPLNLQVHSLLRQDSTPFPNSQGFSGEILVVSAGSQTTSAKRAASGTEPSGTAVQRALAFRRPGAAVDLLDFATGGSKVSTVTQRVIVADPAAVSERPHP